MYRRSIPETHFHAAFSSSFSSDTREILEESRPRL